MNSHPLDLSQLVGTFALHPVTGGHGSESLFSDPARHLDRNGRLSDFK